MMRLLIFFIMCIVISGCVPKPQAQQVQSEVALLLPEYQQENLKPLPVALGIRVPQGVSIESDKLYYIKEGVRKTYAYHRWEGNLARQMHDRLALAFAQKAIFKDIAKQSETMRPDWLLEIEVLDFIQQILSEDSSSRVHFVARMRIVDLKTRVGISQKIMNFETPVEGLGVDDTIKAYNHVLLMWMNETTNWVKKVGEEKYAR